MTTTTKRTTIYLDAQLHRVLRIRALETSQSISKIINQAIRREFMEDQKDLEDIDKRAKEPSISREELLKKLKADGKL